MGKFAELCKGKTMGAFFLLLLSPGKTLSYMEEDQTTVAVTIGYECTSLTRGSNYFVAPRTRLPARNMKNRPDSLQCTAVLWIVPLIPRDRPPDQCPRSGALP